MYYAPQSFCVSSAPPIHPLISRLREIAEERHLTQRELAQELGVSERTVSYWFTSDTVPQKRYRKVLSEWIGQAA